MTSPRARKVDQRLRSLALGLAAMCAACPGSLEDPERFTGATRAEGAPGEGNGVIGNACDDAPKRIFAQRCVSAGCHNAHDEAQGLDLESDDLVTRLVDVRASEGAGLLINRGAIADSVLYTKLTTSPPFGARMPLSGALDDASIACVLRWITQAASPPNADAGAGDAATD